MTLGSLFDGSGGFPLAGVLNGIEPVWASEIEPYPMRVTAARFPHMKQLGDVCKINGAEIEPVDIITFGSPCQDLSVAGAQKGIHNGERSSLFFEAIRIIKEMRDATADKGTDKCVRPRWAVWENVPGAFSSNKGEDFRAVLQAFAGVCERGLSIPRPKKWSNAGSVVGSGWSLAWRTYDAQYWGVPQRRKRIYLVADFGSERAGEILFERESMRGNPAQGREAWQAAPADAEGSVRGMCFAFKERAGKPGGQRDTRRREPDLHLADEHRPVDSVWRGCLQSIAVKGEDDAPAERSQRHRSCGGGCCTDRPRSQDMNRVLAHSELPVVTQGGVLKALYSVENHPNDSRAKLRADNTVQTLSSRMGTGGNNVPLILGEYDE